MSAPEQNVPPVGEEIHLPGNSAVPVLCALGITLAIVGITSFWWVMVPGILLTIGTIVRWILDTRRDIAELPLEH